MRPLIFLDFDGVLNSIESSLSLGGWHRFDQVAVGLVARLRRHADALIVVSSTWRIGCGDVATLKERMVSAGGAALAEHTIGMTARLNRQRGEEIAEWLQRKPHAGPYVILDDDSDMLPEQPFVQTTVMRGFGLPEYVAALKILMPQSSEIPDLQKYVDFPPPGMRKAAGWY